MSLIGALRSSGDPAKGKDQEGEEGEFAATWGGGVEGVVGVGVPPRKASGSGCPLEVRTRHSSPCGLSVSIRHAESFENLPFVHS